MKRFVFALFILFAALPAFAAGNKSLPSEHVRNENILRCGYISYPPYFSIDLNSGAKEGIMVDILQAMGKLGGFKTEWNEETGWGTMIEGLRQGRYDAVCSAVWINARRAREASFSKPVGFAPLNLWKAHKQNVQKKPNDKGARFIAIDGTTEAKLTAELWPQGKLTTLSEMTSYGEMMEYVQSGKSDFIILEDRMAADYNKTHPGAFEKVTVDSLPVYYPIAIVLPMNDPQLKTIIDTALDEMMEMGTLRRIVQKYSVDGVAPFVLPPEAEKR